MRRIVYIIITVFVLFSCDNNLLNLTPSDSVSEDDVWNDESLIDLYVNNCYLGIDHGFYQGMLCSASDESYDIHDAGEYYIVQQGNLTSDNITDISANLNIWSDAYSYIRLVNVFFEKIDNAPVDDDSKQEMKGEMKFIRAFIYANLIWRYGGVPIIDYVFELNDDYSIGKDSYDDCVDFICSELDDAISLLPDLQEDDELGRASADAAMALKSRVLLYAASPLNNPDNDLDKWQDAADAAEDLLNSGYSLYNDYQNLFLSDNAEIIFARYFTQANSTSINTWNGRNGDSGWGGNCPTQNLVNDYEMINGELPYEEEELIVNPSSGYDPDNPYVNRDPRFYASILYDGAVWMDRETETYSGGLDSRASSSQSWNATLTGYYLKKFIPEDIAPSGSSTNPTSPWIFFRYAEILLNYAEASFELGDEETARKYVNMVRSRSGVEMPSITATGEKLKEKIHHERRIELAFESHRFFDVRRWKTASNTENRDLLKIVITQNGDDSKTFEIEKLLERAFYDQHYLLPIPYTEISKSNGSLEQNSGYD